MKRGVLILILVLVVIFAAIALIGGYIYMQFTREPDIPENALLILPVSGPVSDLETSPVTHKTTIKDIFFHLQRAKTDKRVQGLLLKISWIQAGPAVIEELGLLIRDFRESGKPVHAFIEDGGLNEYLLASYAQSITAMPGSDLFLKHYASEALFLRGTLDKLGIEAEFYHIGEYKTGASIYTRDGMSPEHKESLTTLLRDITDHTIRTIAHNRKMDADKVRFLIDSFFMSNETYKKEGLLDSIGYADEIFSQADSSLKPLPFSRYAQTSRPDPFPGPARIALLFASGEIHAGGSGGPSMFGNPVLGSDDLTAQIRSIRRRDDIKAVVLRIDSPGGSATASEAIRHELKLLEKQKPLVVSMGSLAASGGYWLSTSAKHIVCLNTTLTGSIGVLGGKFVNRGFYDKIGLKKELVESGDFAGMFSDIRPFTADERQRFQSLLQRTYARFVGLVSSSRELTRDQTEAAARGRVWSGFRAVELGLADQHGGLLDALAAARRLAGFADKEPAGLVILPKRKSILDVLIGMTSGVDMMESPKLETLLQRFNRVFPAAIMPFRVRFQ